MSEKNIITEKIASLPFGIKASVAQKIHLICGIVTAVTIVVAAICFAVSCVDIYNGGGTPPFTKESITAHFELISIPTFIAIFSVLVSGIAALVFPPETSLGKIYNPYIPLSSYRDRLKLDVCDKNAARDILYQRKKRFIIRVSAIALCAVLLIAALIFSLDFSRYTATDINAEILGCTVISLPLSVLGILSLFVGELLASTSATRELELTKAAISENREVLAPKKKLEKRKSLLANPLILNIFRAAVLCLAIVFIILGILNGGMEQVLGKAVRICTECIGLG